MWKPFEKITHNDTANIMNYLNCKTNIGEKTSKICFSGVYTLTYHSS